MLAVVIVILAKLVVTFRLELEKRIKKDNKVHIFKHLHSTTTYFDSYNSFSFEIIDKANSKFDLKFKEALHINWRNPNLNVQQNHLALTFSLLLAPLLCFFLSLFLYPSLSSIISITSDINYRHLLLS